MKNSRGNIQKLPDYVSEKLSVHSRLNISYPFCSRLNEDGRYLRYSIRAIRNTIGLSLFDASSYLGINYSTLYSYETGRTCPTSEVLSFFESVRFLYWETYMDIHYLARELRNSQVSGYPIMTSYASYKVFQKHFKKQNPSIIDYKIREAAISTAVSLGICDVEIVR